MNQNSPRTLKIGLFAVFCLAALGVYFLRSSGENTSGETSEATWPKVIFARSSKPKAPQPPLKIDGPLTTKTMSGPSWAKNLPIYEVNWDVYGFTKGQAMRQFEQHLPVLKKMGVGLLWLMPIYPRGHLKGFGSPYSVRDYQQVNPDLGSKADFQHLVNTAHALGLHVLLDWVPNHTAWDNALITAHPEFYVKDAKGQIAQAYTWGDVAQLDYGKAGQWNQPLWNTMRDNMSYWVRTFGIDGFRCDVAGSNGRVPVEFWNWLRPQLNALKPVFMLAEADNPEVHPAFDMNYQWSLPPILWQICAGHQPASNIDDELRKEAAMYPAGAIQMRFLDNHDWHPHADWGWGTGAAIDISQGVPQVAPLMVLCTTLPGKPLIYNGQEMSLLKVNPPLQAEARLSSPVWGFYSRLLQLYQEQPAVVQGSFTKIVSNHDDKVYAFVRQSAESAESAESGQRGQNRVLVVVNLSDQAQAVTLNDASSANASANASAANVSLAGDYTDWFGKRLIKLDASPSFKLAPWAYQVYVGHAK